MRAGASAWRNVAMNVTIGSAPDSWGVWFPSDPKQTPWNRFMDEVAEAGFEWIELGPRGYLPEDPDKLRKEMDSRGLKTCGTFIMDDLSSPTIWPQLKQETEKTAKLVSDLGGRFIVLIGSIYSDLFTGEQIAPARLSDERWKTFIENTHRIADIVHDRYGLTVVYHPHAETNIEYEDQIERFLADTDPQRVQLCLDTGHHAYRGGDPIAFMHKHHRRIPYLHLKSVDGEVQRKVERENIPFGKAVAIDMFCEPSKGAVDFIAFRDVLREIDFNGFGIVEQDMYPAPFDKPLPISKRTRQYLKKNGIG
jgi:inosose dehydratase